MNRFKQLLASALLCLSVALSGSAVAADGKQFLIPIAGDITVFIPTITTPTNVAVTVTSQTVGGSIYNLSWTAVTGATYYQILITDDSGAKSYFETTSLTYTLAGLPVGTSRVEILACNSQNQCGVGAYVGTYVNSEKVTYAHSDILGSPILETDQAGNVVQEFHYKPFGETKEVKKETVGYTGHLEDTDLSLTYMQARYYDPVLGRFYGNDPVGFRDTHSVNRYAYANNNPYKFTDPTGKIPLIAPLAFIVVGVTATAPANAPGPADTPEQMSGVDVIAAVIPVARIAKAEQLAVNVANGIKAEKAVAKELGDKVAGKQVTFKTSDGTTTRADIVTKDKGVVEVKSGDAKLSQGQQKLQDDVNAGREVTPVGKNAEAAGLRPGEPTKMSSCRVERKC